MTRLRPSGFGEVNPLRASGFDEVNHALERVLVLDNRDSFVFNLVDEFRARGASVRTLRSDLSLDAWTAALDAFLPHLVVLSPGPGRPEEAGVTVEWLRTSPAVPVLGICLGHQALALAAGGEVHRAPRPVHGRKDRVTFLEDEPIFEGFGGSLPAARYHSLVVRTVPKIMKVVATVEDSGETLVMGIRHRSLCQLGLQFHPESILTPLGRTLLWRFLDEAKRHGETS